MRYKSKTLLTIIFLLTLGVSSALCAPVKGQAYWVSRLARPDSVVLAPSRIDDLNRDILGKIEQMADVEKMPDNVQMAELYLWLLYDPVPDSSVSAGRKYTSGGRILNDEWFSRIRENMSLMSVKEVNRVSFGVLIERADMRAFPTDDPIYERRGKAFDSAQYSSFSPPERVALLHVSKDGLWGFFQTRTLRGWMRLDKVAIGDRREVFAIHANKPLVVTGSYVSVYQDAAFSKLIAAIPMGAAFDTGSESKSAYVIKYPSRGAGGLVWTDAYVKKKADVGIGFLPYTQRNAIRQSFKMMGEEYGWGGRNGLRDCSQFIKDVFASMGVKLPRNSRDQQAVGELLAGRGDAPKEVAKALKRAEAGVTLLGLDRHIMLYLGERDGKPYVIHQIFGYMEGARMKLINKVAVTGLDLGSRSKLGPLKKRLRSIVEVNYTTGKKGAVGSL